MPKSAKGEQLRDEFNAWLAPQKESGKLDEMCDFWCSSEEPNEIMDFEALPDINGTIRIAAPASSRPEVFYFNNTLSGYTIELIYNFCRVGDPGGYPGFRTC